jgi:hypothetical protein
MLASNNSRNVPWAAIGITTPDVDSVHSPNSDLAKEQSISSLLAVLVDLSSHLHLEILYASGSSPCNKQESELDRII